MNLRDELTGIEQGLWTNNPVLYRDTLIEGALLVFPETGVIGRDIAVEAVRNEIADGQHWAKVEFNDVHVMPLASNVATLTYSVTAKWNNEAASVCALVSSVYVKQDSSWKLALHQQTPLI